MTPPVLPYAAFGGVVPANLPCGFCGQPVQKQFFRALDRFACDNCAVQIRAHVAKNVVTPTALAAAAGAGLAVALAGGAIWAITVHITGWNIGYIALGIGYAVGKIVHFVSGKRRGVSLQWLATILSVIGVVVGKIGLFVWGIIDSLHTNGDPVNVQNVLDIFTRNTGLLLRDPFDLLWMALAGWTAWRLCKAPKILMAGPYAYKPSSGGMQFDTVEPLHDIPPAGRSGLR